MKIIITDHLISNPFPIDLLDRAGDRVIEKEYNESSKIAIGK